MQKLAISNALDSNPEWITRCARYGYVVFGFGVFELRACVLMEVDFSSVPIVTNICTEIGYF